MLTKRTATATLIIVILAAVVAIYILTGRHEKSTWVYYGPVISPTGDVESIKDPEFVRYPDHTVFKDDEGFYYIVASYFKKDGVWLTGVLKTKICFLTNLSALHLFKWTGR